MALHHRIHSQPKAGTAEYFAMRRAIKRDHDGKQPLSDGFDNFWNIVSGPEYVARGRELAALMSEPLTADPGDPANKYRR